MREIIEIARTLGMIEVAKNIKMIEAARNIKMTKAIEKREMISRVKIETTRKISLKILKRVIR